MKRFFIQANEDSTVFTLVLASDSPRLHADRYEVTRREFCYRVTKRTNNMYQGLTRFHGAVESGVAEFSRCSLTTRTIESPCSRPVYKVVRRGDGRGLDSWELTRTLLKYPTKNSPGQILDDMEAYEAFEVGMFMCELETFLKLQEEVAKGGEEVAKEADDIANELARTHI